MNNKNQEINNKEQEEEHVHNWKALRTYWDPTRDTQYYTRVCTECGEFDEGEL